jgi:hypothetical protein
MAELPFVVGGALVSAANLLRSVPFSWRRREYAATPCADAGTAAVADQPEPIHSWFTGFYQDNVQISGDLWRSIVLECKTELEQANGCIGDLASHYSSYRKIAEDPSQSGATRDAAKVAMDGVLVAYRRWTASTPVKGAALV